MRRSPPNNYDKRDLVWALLYDCDIRTAEEARRFLVKYRRAHFDHRGRAHPEGEAVFRACRRLMSGWPGNPEYMKSFNEFCDREKKTEECVTEGPSWWPPRV